MNIYSYISESYLWFGYQLRFLAPQLRTRLHAISFIPQRARTVARRTTMDPSPLKQQLSMWKARTHTHTHMHTDAFINCQNEMPVLEGEAVEIWCEIGLSDS